MSLIDCEIDEVSKLCEHAIQNAKLVTCINSLVRVDIKHSATKQLTVCLRFPDGYPHRSNVLVELKSKSLCDKLLDGLTTLSEQKAKEILGKPQILHVLKCINSYLAENPLCIVYQEVADVRKKLGEHGGDLKLRQKASSVTLVARGGQYYFKAKIHIPDDYPLSCVSWNAYESNLPDVLVRFLNGQAREIARQCVEPPLRVQANAQPFEARPSFARAIGFLVEATNEFHLELCPICKRCCLPIMADSVVTDDTDDGYVERVYCGHIYHQGCLKQYVREPPFPTAGKTCPAQKKHPRSDERQKAATPSQPPVSVASRKSQMANAASSSASCSVRLSHDRWGLNVKLAEARWAQQQARVRELEEVIDFLQ